MMSIFLVALASSAIADCPQPEAFYSKFIGTECLDALVEEEYRKALAGNGSEGVYSKELLAMGGFPFRWKDPDGSKAKACQAKFPGEMKPAINALAPECKETLKNGLEKFLLARVSQLTKAWLKEFLSFRSGGGYAETRWGMTQDEVKKRVKGLVGDSKRLVKKDKIAEFGVVMGYDFIENHLISVNVLVMEDHTSSQKYVEDFVRLKELLTTKYGSPEAEEDIIWNSETAREMLGTDNLGAQVLLGHVKLESKWQDATTGIVLQCTGDKLKIQNGISYVSLELLPWAKTKMDAADSSKL